MKPEFEFRGWKDAISNNIPKLTRRLKRKKFVRHLWTWLFLLLFLGSIVWVLNKG